MKKTRKQTPEERAKKNRETFIVKVLHLFQEFTPSEKIELRDYIKDGERSGQHEATVWSNEHKIIVSEQIFDLYPREIHEALDTICHEAHHAAMHDINAMLDAGGRLTKEEVELIMERAAWVTGKMICLVVKNIDSLKKDYIKCGGPR